jgi:selenide, water dikinase
MAVTGLVSPRHMITNAAAQPGDFLVLTKPLGTGIVTTAIKRGIASSALSRRAVNIMLLLNTAGTELARRNLVRAGTDVSGFGLLGHLGSMCRASGVGAEVNANRVPVLGKAVLDLIASDCVPAGTRENLKTANEIADWDDTTEVQKFLLADAQTSGGLLLAVRPDRLQTVLAVLKKHRTPVAAIIGRMVRSTRLRIHVYNGDVPRKITRRTVGRRPGARTPR